MEWKPYPGREDHYEVSSCGSLRNLLTGKPVSIWKNSQGYMAARLSRPRETIRVHRAVAQTFIENPNALPFVNHIDCVKNNNNKSNLEWCTQWQNLRHSALLGRMQNDYWKGKRSPSAVLDDSQVALIRKEYAKGGKSWSKIGKEFGVSKRTIGRILSGETYKVMPLPEPPVAETA
jgi:hypothetical protein